MYIHTYYYAFRFPYYASWFHLLFSNFEQKMKNTDKCWSITDGSHFKSIVFQRASVGTVCKFLIPSVSNC